MIGAGKIVQWLGTLAVLPGDLSLLLSTHMRQITTVSNSGSGRPNTLL